MKKSVFRPADILIPNNHISHNLWSVIACDQFSSEREYWQNVKKAVGSNPSTLNMIIPEAYLNEINEDNEINKISMTMEGYISQGLFKEIKNSYIYVERTLSDGSIRKGLVGIVDLEEYDFLNPYSEANGAAIIASEGTAIDRLPPRIRIRTASLLEVPHVMTLIADINKSVIEPLESKACDLPLLYDVDLMEGGGRIKGFQVSGNLAEKVEKTLQELHTYSEENSKCFMIMGDGNHSLAAAKTYWDKIKPNLNYKMQEIHPARFALLEVNNIYDTAVKFEAIHRVLFNVDNEQFVDALKKSIPYGNDYEIKILSSGKSENYSLSASSTGNVIEVVQVFIDDYIQKNGGNIDYIHDINAVEKLAENEDCIGIVLPTISKAEFFEAVADNGAFPRKSFSIGHARDKRYYMECRKIK